MQWLESPYPVALLVAASLSASLAFVAWRRRGAPGATPLVVLALAVAIWQAGYAIETASTGVSAKILWAKVEYLGIVTMSTAWLAVTLQYSGRGEWLTRRNLALLSLVPLATLVLAWTNGSHDLIWSDVTLEASGSLVVGRFDHGPAFWAFGTYSYLLMMAGVMILGETLLRSPELYWRQSTALLVSALAPWASNWIFALRLGPVSLIDPTPFAFVISVVALGWALTRSRLLDIAPVARNMAFEHVNSGILVLDTSERVVDCNITARRILSQSESEVIGLPISEAWPDSPDFVRGHASDARQYGTVTVERHGDRRIYDIGVSPIYDGRKSVVGRLILFHDSTERERAESERRALEVKALAQSKLATLGEVAAGVAHEINQPLTYISTMIQSLREDLRLKDFDEESAQDRLAESQRQVERITRIVQHLRTFGRADDTEMGTVHLGTVLDNTLLLVEERLRNQKVEVEHVVEEGLPMVTGNANQPEQVFVKLFEIEMGVSFD